MLGSAVSSRTPTDFQPRSTMGFSEFPLMNCQALTPGPHIGWPHCAVGMHRALDSEIGLPSRSTSASRMLVFVTPPEVSRSFTMSPMSPVQPTLPTRDRAGHSRAERTRPQKPEPRASASRMSWPSPPLIRHQALRINHLAKVSPLLRSQPDKDRLGLIGELHDGLDVDVFSCPHTRVEGMRCSNHEGIPDQIVNLVEDARLGVRLAPPSMPSLHVDGRGEEPIDRVAVLGRPLVSP